MVKAIDIHIHPPRPSVTGELSEGEQAMDTYFRATERSRNAEELYQKYKELDIFGVLFGVDSETVSGQSSHGSNDYVAGIVRNYPGQFIGFGSVDPWKGKAAVLETERCAKQLGMRGMKFHPCTQEFFANDRRFYPLWQACSDLGLVALFHSGTTAVGAGQPGGGGIKLKFARPIPYMDDIAADFPDLKIVLAHPSFPWQDEQLAMLVHKPNVFMDLSGWSPKYFSPLLIQYANTIAQDKVMFGSDYPALTPERWLRDFESMPFTDAVRPKIFLENARRLLQLEI
ncbi:MAG: amidohydrolase family protein [Dehalococcoidia bacterium]